ncbi:nucleic-acid-binding protein from transposon X-element [Trichonephila clavipes]|nr:nucleic-acid-binding protein from transposon X-element [Trichonephila clavipes]
MDNRNEPTDMDLIDSPRRTPTPPPLSACEQILQTKAQLQKMETFKSSSWPASLNFKSCPITTRMSLSTDVPFRSFKKLKKQLTWRNRISNKRKEESDFEYPPLRKTTKKQILNIPNDSISISPNRFSLPSDSNIEEITGSQNAIPVVTPKPPSATGPTPSGNQNPVSTLPPPVMLRITETVVLKGLPRNFKVEEIQADLEELGFTPEKVNQLIGRRSKQPIPVFLVTLPRSIENLKIFHLKTLSYLSIRVEGYNGKGVTQCYTCNHFHHNSENCHLNPRCLKCGEGHITRECPITERLETAYCINCEILINPNQYGFTNKLSTLHPLLRLTESISEGFQKEEHVGVVFLDIQKAFDRVWILGLTFKLITYDIPSPLIHLIHSYSLTDPFGSE